MEMQELQELFSVWEVLRGCAGSGWMKEEEKKEKVHKGKFFFPPPFFFFPGPCNKSCINGSRGKLECVWLGKESEIRERAKGAMTKKGRTGEEVLATL